MTLVELLNIADKGYPDQFLSEIYDNETGEVQFHADIQGDDLALFIVRELSETFVPTNASDVQLCAAIVALEKARDDLDSVAEALRKHLDQV